MARQTGGNMRRSWQAILGVIATLGLLPAGGLFTQSAQAIDGSVSGTVVTLDSTVRIGGSAKVEAPGGLVKPRKVTSRKGKTTKVRYWLDSGVDPRFVGGMVVAQKSDRVYAYARYFEGRACFAGRSDASQVRLNGAHDYASISRFTEVWPLRARVAQPSTTFGTVGEWRRVTRKGMRNVKPAPTTRTLLKQLARMSSLKDVRSRCRWAKLAVPAMQTSPFPDIPAVPGDPQPSPPPNMPTPTPEPTPTPPPPASAVITGNPCSTFEAAPNCVPARVSAGPNNTSAVLGSFGYGQRLTARCWILGQTITDGSNADPSDDGRTFTSNLWYGIDWNGGRGYVAAVWTTKSENRLGLSQC